VAKLDLASFHLAQAQLRSPITGVVLSITAFARQLINTRVNDQALLTVADNSAMYLQVRFSTDGSLPAGLPVKINGDNN
jgi:multidrug resistance efflux pump